jgi:hypothetical protein
MNQNLFVALHTRTHTNSYYLFLFLQLKSMPSSSLVVSFARVLYDDMAEAASHVKHLNGVTAGCLTPANRFTHDCDVPECTRYNVTDKVCKFSPTATKTQLDAMAKAREQQMVKRAKLQ